MLETIIDLFIFSGFCILVGLFFSSGSFATAIGFALFASITLNFRN